MKSGLRVAFLLLLVTGTTTVKGSDLSDDLHDNDPRPVAAAPRPKRWSGFKMFDSFHNNGATTGPKPAKPTARGGGFGLDLSDALHPDPKPSKPSKPADFEPFDLEHALRPAVKPAVNPSGGDCQATLVQKLSDVIENQKQQLRLLQQVTARFPSSRFYDKPMR